MMMRMMIKTMIMMMMMFTSYQPAAGLPYNHLLWTDSRERLVEVALQVSIKNLDDTYSKEHH